MIRYTKVTSTLTLAAALAALLWATKARANDHTDSVAWAIATVETYNIACERLPLAFLKAVDDLMPEVSAERRDVWTKKVVRDSARNPDFCATNKTGVEKIRATLDDRINYHQCLINEHEHGRLGARRFCSILHPIK